MKMIHLCTYYIGNKLFKKLFLQLSEDVQQTVYIPIKNESLLNNNLIEAKGLEFHYDVILKKHDRYLYKGKIKKQKNRMEELISSIQSFDIIHAHTLFSDGGTAYLLKKKYGLDYIVSVRNTDIHFFYKYAVHQRPFIHKVLQNAAAVVFISHAYKKKTLDLLPVKVAESIKNKIHVIPNGIDDKWFTIQLMNKKLSDKLHLLYTGTLNKNKNLMTVLKLVKKLQEEGKDVYLNVAGDGPLKDELIAHTNQEGLKNRVQFYGNVSKEELINLADQSHIFILPSYKETFGISYIEAISRGVPVIYTRNEGIDGYFPEGSVGYSTDPDDVNEMSEKLNLIIDSYEQISRNCISEAKRFNWEDIAKTYVDLYKTISNENNSGN